MFVRSSITFYGNFNLDMDRSPGFGSTNTNCSPSSDLVSLRLRTSLVLNLANISNSPDRSTKSTLSHSYGALAACKHRVSDSFSLPFRGSFQLSITVLFTIGHQVVFRLGGWSPRLPTGFLVSGGTLDPALSISFSLTGLLPTMVCLPIHFC